MNFSEYTLVSFGDSFTFGEDTVPFPDLTTVYDRESADKVEKRYKFNCNKNSYTQFLADNLGFKDSLNFGTRGASNERSMTNLESFLRNNPKKKVFVLFNFTCSSRYVQFFKEEKGEEYGVEDMLAHQPHFSSDTPKYAGINSKIIAHHWTFFRNNIQEVYNHVKQRRAVYYILSSYDVPYITFDGINDMDARILSNNPLQYINKKNIGGGYGNFMYNDDESYVFKEMDFLNSYREELVNNTPLLNHLLKDHSDEVFISNSITNLNDKIAKFDIYSLIEKIGIDRYDDKNHYLTDNRHWTTEGHIEVAKVLEKFINERYN